MTKKKHIDIFKLEDRVLFDAAGTAEIVNAAEQAANQVSEAEVQVAEERDALKNAPPENPAAGVVAAGTQSNGPAADPAAASDIDAAVDAIIEGEIAQPEATAPEAPADSVVEADGSDGDVGPSGDMPGSDADQIVADADGSDNVQQDIDDFINADGGDSADGDDSGVVFADAFAVAPEAPPRELVIINSSVKDAQSIIDSLGENTDVLILEKGQDALDAINEYLDANSDVKYSAMHIVSHGNAGYFILNGEVIDAESVAKDPASWANIGQHLTGDADIMLYGCNIAGNMEGQMLVSEIAKFTGADVAASVDNTGVNGNWDLEYSIGAIETGYLDIGDYGYTLSGGIVTISSGSGSGSLDYFLNTMPTGGDLVFQVNSSVSTFVGDLGGYTFSNDTGFDCTVTFNGNVNVTGSMAADTNMVFNGTMNNSGVISGSGDLTFNGALSGTGTISGTHDIVTYHSGATGTIFGGVYNDLVLNGQNVTSMTLNGELSGSADVTFDGVHITRGNDASVNMTGGTIAYTGNYAGNGGVLNGTYYNLTLSLGKDIDGRDVTVNRHLAISTGTTLQSSSANTHLVLNGTSNATFVSFSNGTITYGAGFASVLEGTYQNLVLNGQTVSDSLGIALNGTLSGSGDLTFGSRFWAGSGARVDMTGGTITYTSEYAADARGQRVINGNYHDLVLGDRAVADWTIGNSIGIRGTLDAGNVSNALIFNGVVGMAGAIVNTPATVTYSGGHILHGNYTNLILLQNSVSPNSANLVDGVVDVSNSLVMKGSAQLYVTSNGDFTLTGTWTDTATSLYLINGGVAEFNVTAVSNIKGALHAFGNGTLTLNVSNSQFSGYIAGGVFHSGMANDHGGTINLTGTNTTFNCNVGLGVYGGTLNITGSSLTFNYHVTNALGWYNTSDLNGYNPVDNTAYVTDSNGRSIAFQNGEDLVDGAYEGVINIASAGQIDFAGQVVTVGTFNINSGTVNFWTARLVAVAAGDFNINGGKVNFNGNVYVSTMFNGDLAGETNQGKYNSSVWHRSSVFSINGGEVAFNGNLQNWVRTYRGGWYMVDSDKVAYGDLADYMYANAEYAGLEFRRTVTSTVNFNGGSVTFGGNSAFLNYGVFGDVYFNVADGASVKFNEIRNFNANAYTPPNATANGGTITWSSEWVSEYGVNHPFTSAIQGVYRGGISNDAIVTIESDTITVSGTTLNSGFSSFGRAMFYLEGENNKFDDAFTNTRGAWFEVNGAGNKFFAVTNSGTAFMTVSAQSNFVSLTNSAILKFTDAGSTQIDNFTNGSGGETSISGNSDGFSFVKSMNITGGDVIINAELGVPIEADIALASGASLTVSMQNSLTGTIDNAGMFVIAGRGISMTGDFTNRAGGEFVINNIDSSTELSTITGAVINAGIININQAGLVFNALDKGFTNSGTLTISKYAVFNHLVNQASGKLVFAQKSGTEAGAEGTVFVNLENAGSISVTVNSIIFTDGLKNSGTLEISATGVRFKDMVATDGSITFVNSGLLRLLTASAADEFVDVHNTSTGSIYINVPFDFALVRNEGNILISNLGSINFRGNLINDGVIGGAGNVAIYAGTSGSGTFALTAGTVTYNYTAGNAPVLDTDGFWRVNGEIVGDHWSNRPEYVEGIGWCVHGTSNPLSPETVGLSRYSDITIDRNGLWQIGQTSTSVSATANVGDTPVQNGAFWSFMGSDTQVSTIVNQAVFGGSLHNLTVRGEAVIGDTSVRGVTIDAGSSLQIGGKYVNGEYVSGGALENGVRLLVVGAVSFNGEYQDAATSSLTLASSGNVTFNVTTKNATSGRMEATVRGTVDNNGSISVAREQSLIFLNATSGSGAVDAAFAVVTYNNVVSDATQHVFSGNYQILNLYGNSNSNGMKLLDNSTVVAGSLVNEAGMTLNQSSLTVNRDASGNGDYNVNTESLIDFRIGSTGYTIGGDIVIAADAFGVNFRGSNTAKIMVAGTVTNHVLVSSVEPRRVGITAGDTVFSTVENNGTFTVLNTGVALGAFTQSATAGSQLIFALAAGGTFNIDGSASNVIGLGGEIVVRSGTVVVSGLIAGGAGIDNKTFFTVNPNAVLELSAAGQVLPQVTVNLGATLVVNDDAVIGTLGDATNGLTLNGKLNVLGGTLQVYTYRTFDNDAPTASIYLDDGATLTFVDDAIYGGVYAAIEVAGGTLTPTPISLRLNAAGIDEWIVIDSKTGDASTSAYAPGSKFIVKEGYTLTVDGSTVQGDLSEAAFRVLDGNLVFTVNAEVTGEVLIADGSTVTVNADVSVIFGASGTVTSAGLIQGQGNISFLGNVVTSVNGVDGQINMAGGNVTYGENAGALLFAGTYADLTVDNVAGVGDVTINGILSGVGTLTFSSRVDGTAVVRPADQGAKGTLSVVYGGNDADQKVFGGTYNNLTFVGAHTVNPGGSPNAPLEITVDGTIAITGGTVASPVTLTLNNANLMVNGAVANADTSLIAATGTTGTVTYDYSGAAARDIYSGSYRNLVITGSGTQNIGSLNLATALSGDGTLAILSAIGGSGTVKGGMLNVSYGGNIGSGFLAGEYGSLVLKGETVKTISRDITVNGSVQATGTLLGSGNLTFLGNVIGSAKFGTATETYTGTVTYGQAAAIGVVQSVYGGSYSSLVLSGGDKLLSADLTAGQAAISANITIRGGAAVELTQMIFSSTSSTVMVTGGSSLSFSGITGNYKSITADGTLIVNGNYTFDSRLTLNGALKVGNNSTVVIGGGVKTDGSAAYSVDAGSSLKFNGVGSETGSFSIGSINNRGTVSFDGSHATISGAVVNTGTLVLANHSVLALNGASTIDGTFTINAGNTLNVNATVRINDLTTLGVINIGSDTTVGDLTLYKVNSGDAQSRQQMNVGDGSSLTFDPYVVYQMIYGTVSVGKEGTLIYDDAWTGFYNKQEYWIIINTDTVYSASDLSGTHGYKIINGATLTLDGSITVTGNSEFWILSGSELAFAADAGQAGATVIAGAINNEAGGVITVSRNIALNGDVTGGGTIQAANDTTVSYNGSGSSIYAGTYGNLEVNGSGTWTVGDVTLNGTLTGSGSLVFAGATAGDGSVDMAGTVTYRESAMLVYAGNYGNLVLQGSKNLSGDITVSDTFTVEKSTAQDATYAVITGDGELVLNKVVGTDADNARFSHTGTVTYLGNTTLFSGSYANLAVNGTGSVGDVTIGSTLTGSGSLTFNGTTTGDAVVDMAGEVVYGEAAIRVFGGTYGALTLNGTTGKTLAGAVTVNGNAAINSGLAGAYSLAFNGSTSGSGLLNMTGGVVSYSELAGALFGGTYSGLTVTGGSHGLLADVTVNAAANLSGMITGSNNITFNGTTQGDAGLNMSGSSAVTYGANAGNIYFGTYQGLNLVGSKTFMAGNIVVNNTLTLGAATYTISNGAELTLNKIVDESGTVYRIDAGGTVNFNSSNIGDDKTDGDGIKGQVTNRGTINVNAKNDFSYIDNYGTVMINYAGAGSYFGTFTARVGSNLTFGDNAHAAFGEFDNYGTLLINNSKTTFKSLINQTSGTITVAIGTDKTYTLTGLVNSGTIEAASGILVLAGLSEGSSGTPTYLVRAGAVLSFETADLKVGGTVDVDAGGQLRINANTTFNNSVTMASGSRLTGTALVTFSGATSGDATVGGELSAVYSANAQRIYSGTYKDLTLTGSKTLDGSITVSGAANFTGTITGNNAVLVFSGTTTGSAMMAGTVTATYGKDAANVFGGIYENLTLQGSKEVNLDLTVNGTLRMSRPDGETPIALTGKGALVFNGNVYFAAGDTITNTNSVTYNGPGNSILDGTYKNLVINGGNRSVGDITLNGTLSGNGGTIRFNGTTSAGDEAKVAGITAYYGEKATVVFGGTYEDLYLTGSKSLDKDIVVNGDLTAYKTSKGAVAEISGGAKLTVNGQLVNFGYTGDNVVAKFTHAGTVVLNGVGFSVSGSSFTNLVVNGTGIFFQGTAISASLKGSGSLTFGGGMSGEAAVDMTGGTVTYNSDSGDMITYAGKYHNLTLHANKTIGNNIIVNQEFVASSSKSPDRVTIAEGGSLTLLSLGSGHTSSFRVNVGGSLTFGTSDPNKLAGPADRVMVDTLVDNYGSVTVNENNYTFRSVYNNKGASFTVTNTAGGSYDQRIQFGVNDPDGRYIWGSFVNEYGATVTLNSTAQIWFVGTVSGWTNYGSVTINGFSNFGFGSNPESRLLFINSTNAALRIDHASYTFDHAAVLLHNGGTITAGQGGRIVFNAVRELAGGNMNYVTDQGAITFDFVRGTVSSEMDNRVMDEGLRGNLKNLYGSMTFTTVDQKYYGTVQNGIWTGSEFTHGSFNINATSIFEGKVTNTAGGVTVAAAAAGTVFQNVVDTASGFYINGSTLFAKDVVVQHSFYINAETTFGGNLTVYSSDRNDDANTRFYVNAATVFKGLVSNENRSDSSNWNSTFIINAQATFRSGIVNKSSGSGHLAEFIVNSQGNVFQSISNEGAEAHFLVNSTGNTFNGQVTNSAGLFEINAVNVFQGVVNENNGYFRINHEASGTHIGALTNSARLTVFAGENGEATLIYFNGAVTNSGFMTLEAAGSLFSSTVTNSGTFNVQGQSTFMSRLTNSGTFNVNATSLFQASITNSGTFNVNTTNDFSYSNIINTSSGIFNVNASNVKIGSFENQFRFASMEDYSPGVLNINGANTRISNLKNAGIVVINGNNTHFTTVTGSGILHFYSTGNEIGSLTLDVNLLQETTSTDADGNTVTTHKVYQNGWMTIESGADVTLNLVYTQNPNEIDPNFNLEWGQIGSVIEIKGDGALTVNSQMQLGRAQIIYSKLLLSEDATLNYDPYWTVFFDLEAGDWIIVNSNMTISDSSVQGNYKVVAGGVLTVDGTSVESAFWVLNGGKLFFNNDGAQNGSITVDAGGSVQINAVKSFSGIFSNSGTVGVNSAGVQILRMTNAGTLNLGYSVGGGMITNTGVGTINVNGDGIALNAINNYGTVNLNGANNSVSAGFMSYAGSVVNLVGANASVSGITNNGSINVSNLGASVTEVLNNGTIAARKGGTVTIGSLTEGADSRLVAEVGGTLVVNGMGTVNSTVVNRGTVTVNQATLFTGNVTADRGTFNGAGAITFSGVTSGAGAVFGTDVTYNGTAAQTLIGGAYQKGLTISGGVKSVLADTTVAGMFRNDAGVTVGGQSSLTLGAVSGNGNYTADGSLKFGGAGTVGGTVTVHATGTVTVGAAVNFVGAVANAGAFQVSAQGNGTQFNGAFTNSNTLTLNGSAGFRGGLTNGGKIEVNANNINVANFINNGMISVNGTGVVLDGVNNGRVDIAGSATLKGTDTANAVYTVQADGILNLADDRAELLGRVDNAGTVNVIGVIGDFVGGLTNNGLVVIAQSASGTGVGGIDNTVKGTLTLNGGVSLDGMVNAGTINVNHANVSYTDLVNNGRMNFSVDTTLVHDIGGTGWVYAAGNATLTLSGFNRTGSNYGTTAGGTLKLTGDMVFTGSIANDGTIATAGNALTFTGATSGNGRVQGDGRVEYSGNSTQVFGGHYADLTISGKHNVVGEKIDATADRMTLNESLTVDGKLTLTGDNLGNGDILSNGKGSVIYGGSSDQRVYNGNYHNFGVAGSGDKLVSGDMTISGNATAGGSASFTAIDGMVTYNGGSQQVLHGTYDDLLLTGSGTKTFVGGETVKVEGTIIGRGSQHNVISLASTDGRQWLLDSDALDFNYMKISDSKSVNRNIYLNGNNELGNNNSGWLVFDSNGGIGDSFPGQFNLNFSSLAEVLGNDLRAAELEALFNEEGPNIFRRRVGQLSDFQNTVTDVSSALESEVNFVDNELIYDEAIFDGADFQDQDYSDIMDVADIFSDQLSAALEEMVAV